MSPQLHIHTLIPKLQEYFITHEQFEDAMEQQRHSLKDDFYTRFDAVMSELKNIRIDFALFHKRLGRVEDQIDVIDSRLDKGDSRFGGIEARLDAIELRLDRLEARLDAVELRLDAVESRLDKVESKLDMVIAILTQQFPQSAKLIAKQNQNSQ